jgi:hypothetical protein
MTNVEAIDNQLNEAIQTLKAEDASLINMNADELIEQAVRGLDGIATIREENSIALVEGRNMFTALVNQLAVKEADLAKRHGIYTAMLSTVEPEMADS